MRVGPYELGQSLGRGGTATVFRARGEDGSEVAVKLLRGRTGLARFVREQRLLLLLSEVEGFVPILDAGESPYGDYLVMPFVAGETLRERLNKRGRLEVEETIELARSLARALAAAHARGIVHRDMKPGNIILSPAPLILDLGLAKHFREDALGASESVSLSKTGTFVGTWYYAAPEQVEDAKRVEAAADVFALGSILLECLEGKRAFSGADHLEIAKRISAGAHEPLTREVPGWFRDVVLRCLEVNPARRYHDGAAVLEALAARRRRRNPILPLVLLGVGALAALLLRPRAPEPTIAVRRTLGSTHRRHGAMVTSIEFAPDGRRVFSTGLDQALRVFDVASGEEVATVPHGSPVFRVAFDRPGKLAATVGDDRLVRLLDAATLREVGTIPLDVARTYAVAFTAEGRLVTGDAQGELRVHDLRTRKEVSRARVHEGALFALALAPGGVVSGGQDGIVRFTPLEDAPPRVVAFHARGTFSLAVSPSGEDVLSGGDDGRVALSRIATGEELATLAGHSGRANTVAWSRDGTRAVTGSFDGTARLWDLAPVKLLRTFVGHRSWVTTAALSPDGTRLATGSNDQTVRLWDTATGRELLPSRRGLDGKVVAVAATSKRALLAGSDGTASLHDLATGAEVWRIEVGSTALRGAVLTDERAFLVTAAGLEVRDLARGALVASVPEPVRSLAPSRGGVVYATGTALGRTDGGRLASVARPVNVVNSSDGSLVVAAGLDGDLEVRDAATLAVRGTAAVHSGLANLAVASDGERVVSLGADGSLVSLDARTLRETSRVRFARTEAWAVALSADARTLALTTDGLELRFLDAATGAELGKHSFGATRDFVSSIQAGGAGFLVGLGRGAAVEIAVLR